MTTYQDILMPQKDVQENRNNISPLQPVVNQPSYMAPDWGGMGGKKNSGEAATQTQQTKQLFGNKPPRIIRTYEDMFDELDKNYAKKNEDIAKREAALKRAKTFATIGDALSAFHTAYSNARGVQPMIPAGTSLSGKWRERYENLMKEKDANNHAHLQALMRLQNMKDTDDYQARSLSLRELEEQRRQVQLNIATRKQDWLEKYQQGMLDIKQEQLEIDRQYKSGQISKMERDAASNELRAQAAMLRAQNAGNGGGGRVGGYTTNTEIHRDERGRETGRTTTRTPAGGEPVTTTTTTTPKPVQKPTSKPVQKKAAASSKTNTNTNTKKKKTGVNWK